MQTPSPLIEVSGLTIHRDRRLVLKELDWLVRPEESWVILGANGSGKTSLLSALTGYLMPSEGVIRVLGQTYGQTDWRDLRREIGLVSASLMKLVEPEETGLDLVASGREAVLNAWKLRREDRRAAQKILQQIGAEALADRPWRILSQGERQRLLIGRALMSRPKLLILDEPCAGLDPVAREHFLAFIDRLAAQSGRPGLVLVTHHVEEISSAFSHILLLKNGRILTQGPVRQCLQSRWLSEAFSAPLHVRRTNNRYHLVIPSNTSAVF